MQSPATVAWLAEARGEATLLAPEFVARHRIVAVPDLVVHVTMVTTKGAPMIVLGIILIIVGLLVESLKILLTIGVILLVVGLILNFVPIGGRRRRFY